METNKEIFEAIEQEDTIRCLALLDSGVPIDHRGTYRETPLIAAARVANVELVRGLLERGAKVDSHDNGGKTALHAAVRSVYTESLEIITLLLEAGADINALDNSKTTPCFGAVSCNFLEALELLVESGADFEIEDQWGEKPVDIALCHDREECIDFLINNGASLKEEHSKYDWKYEAVSAYFKKQHTAKKTQKFLNYRKYLGR